MEQKNSSKQIVLSIIAVAILVVAVIGVSFAFFSYTKTGNSNNVIQTGEIFMAFLEENSIRLTNQFPITNTEALNGLNENEESMSFSVIGYSSGNYDISYSVYALTPNPIDTPSDKIRFPNSNISLFFSSISSSNEQPITTTLENNPTVVSDDVDSTDGWLIARGTIKKGTTNQTQQTDEYTLKMFVNDSVRISDTNASVNWNESSLPKSRPTTYCASERIIENGKYTGGCKLYLNGTTVTVDDTDTSTHTYLNIFSDMYYSLKIRVKGNT